MSLFGTSPPSPSPKPKHSLFDDPSSKPSAGLFSDEQSPSASTSPWTMPGTKRASRSDIIKGLLPASCVPESYTDAFNTLSTSQYGTAGGSVSIAGAKLLVQRSPLTAEAQGLVLRTCFGVGPVDDGAEVGKKEFNVLLALIGLAESGDEVSLDGVDEHKLDLPVPTMDLVRELSASKAAAGPTSRRLRKDSMDNLDADPWGSPAAAGSQRTGAVRNGDTPATETSTAAKAVKYPFGEPARTTSEFTTTSNSPAIGPEGPAALVNGTWGQLGTVDAVSAEMGAGFGGAVDDEAGQSSRLSRSLGNRAQAVSGGGREVITIGLLPDKEGMFLFQHHNYEVKSSRRGSSVVRRFSDFAWLLDCLHKRYPFRQLPLLPPKRVAVNGKHLAADASFMEKRRRGLVRFSNALVRHPVLGKEQLVVMFLTVPTELSIWRKQASVSVQEEFVGRVLPVELEESLPVNLSEIFNTVRAGVRESADNYIALCTLMERLGKRKQGVAADYQRFSGALQNLTEASQSTYAIDTNDVPALNQGIATVSKHMTLSQTLLEDESRAWDQGVLEDLKRHRDNLVGVRDMFDRRERYARDNIPQLERRIETNENKLRNLIAGNGGKPGEQEKVEQAVRADKQSIIDQHARGVFITECVRDELVYFQQSQYHVSRLHQDWSQERVKYAELQADNWRRLSEEVEHMPVEE